MSSTEIENQGYFTREPTVVHLGFWVALLAYFQQNGFKSYGVRQLTNSRGMVLKMS
jgi:hypothetical protein